MALSPAHDVATFLAGTLTHPNPPGGSTVLTYAAGGNLTIGPLPQVDATVGNTHVAVLTTGGPPPRPLMGPAANDNIFVARVQVNVRGPMDNFDVGEGLARACLKKMHLAALSGYLDCLAQETEPNYVGRDERGPHRWTFNLAVRWKGTTAT